MGILLRRPHKCKIVCETTFALGAVRRNPLFWVYASAWPSTPFGTAVHIAALFEEVGRTRVEAFAYFCPRPGLAWS